MFPVYLTEKQLEKLHDVLLYTQDEGPIGQGWASDELINLRGVVGLAKAAQQAALADAPSADDDDYDYESEDLKKEERITQEKLTALISYMEDTLPPEIIQGMAVAAAQVKTAFDRGYLLGN
jgi:hypothetical protein